MNVCYRNSDIYILGNPLSETIGVSEYSTIVTYCLKDSFSDYCFPHFKVLQCLLAALFTTATPRRQLRCPAMEINTVGCAHTVASLFVKNKIMSFAREWMLLEIVILTSLRKTNSHTLSHL